MKKKKIILLSLLLFLSLFFAGDLALASTFTGNLSTGIGGVTGSTVEGLVIVAPEAVPLAGTYKSAQNVVLSAAGSASIHYTIDGSEPACLTGLIYSKPITLSKNQIIKAISCYSGNNSSAVNSFSYTIKKKSGGGGGGGSSSGGGISVPQVQGAAIEEPDIAVLQNQVSSLIQQIKNVLMAAMARGIQFSPALLASLQTMGVSFDAPAPGITGDWRLGDANAEIRLVQTALAKDPAVYPQGLITGYFGPLTQAAVYKFQSKNGLPLTGITDAATREKLNAILSK
jgi:hypothetical protein